MALSKSEAGKLGNVASKAANAKRKEEAIVAYELNPNRCVHCSEPISYAKRNLNKFCSKSCATTFNNPLKPEKTDKINSICEQCSCSYRHKTEKNRTFCSQSCYLTNQNEQNMEMSAWIHCVLGISRKPPSMWNLNTRMVIHLITKLKIVHYYAQTVTV